MKKTERNYYRIGICVSLVFHMLLLFAYFPVRLQPQSMAMETFSVGMVELSQGSRQSQNRVIVKDTSPKNKISPQPRAPQQKPEQSPKTKTALPGKEKQISPEPKVPGNPIPKQVTNPSPTESNTDNSNSKTPGDNGSEKAKEFQPVGMGSGEGMVAEYGAPPSYPKNAMNEGVEGEVRIRVLIRPNGSLEEVLLSHSSGDSRLDRTVINSFRQNWHFKPSLQNYYIDLSISFKLKNGINIKFINSETRP